KPLLKSHIDNLSPGIRYAYGHAPWNTREGCDMFRHIMSVYANHPDHFEKMRMKKGLSGKEPPNTLVDANGNRKEYLPADIQFFRHAVAYLLQRLLSDTQKTTNTNFSNPKGWVEVMYMFALTSVGDSIAVDALAQYLMKEEDAANNKVNNSIAPVIDEQDADDDGPKRLNKGKEKGKHKSGKGLKASKAERVSISEHDGEAARALFRLTARRQIKAVERIADLGVTRRLCKEISFLIEEEVMAYIVEAMLLGIFADHSSNDISESLKTLIINTKKRADSRGAETGVVYPQQRINRFIEKVTRTNYVDVDHVDGYRKEGEKTLEKSRLRRYKRACDKREITPFGPTRAIPLVEE
ncbi:unnamed protein product, partial [Ascophyllum nodosum]